MQELKQAIADATQRLFNLEIEPELERPEENFGDYSTNVAMKLAGKTSQQPRATAEAIAKEVESAAFISKIEVAGPGFINITLTDEALLGLFGRRFDQALTGKTVVTEYSDPNPFKILHAGHLYTTIVGDAIARLLETTGASVHRLNYGGDVGLHVARAMWGILKSLDGENPEKLDEIPEPKRLEWLAECYIAGTEAYEEDDSIRKTVIELNKQIYKLHEADERSSPLAQIYWTCRDWSYRSFEKLYEQLKVDRFERYVTESEITPLALDFIKRGLEKNVFELSEGAVIYKGEEQGLHSRVFLTKEKLPTYEAKDLGLAAMKWQQYKFDLSIILTASDIADYMRVVYAALAHFYPDIVQRSKHLTHGVIKLPSGTKMSSRRGNIVTAEDVLDGARLSNQNINKQDNEEVALGAVKYSFLKQRIGGDIIYDSKESVSLEGNSGPYLQYAHARAASILSKAAERPQTGSPGKLDENERSLARKISEYPEVVEAAARELLPSHICTYLYELAQNFNRFYERSRVVGDPREALRLNLVRAYKDVLKNGLQLLNISAPEKL